MLLETVLSGAFAGSFAKAYGVLWATVVAAVAVGAVAHPARAAVLHCDVLQGAHLCTQAAAGAVFACVELAVGNEECVEQRLENVGLEKRGTSQKTVEITFCTAANEMYGLIELADCPFNLALCQLR